VKLTKGRSLMRAIHQYADVEHLSHSERRRHDNRMGAASGRTGIFTSGATRDAARRDPGSGVPPGHSPNGYQEHSGRGVMVNTHMQLMKRTRMLELYLHSPIHLNDTVIN
jgi:hypothetical protein